MWGLGCSGLQSFGFRAMGSLGVAGLAALQQECRAQMATRCLASTHSLQQNTQPIREGRREVR